MDYQQFTREVQRLGGLSTIEEAGAVTRSVLRALSEVLPRESARMIRSSLPTGVSELLEPRRTEPDPEIDAQTFIGWAVSCLETTLLPDRSFGGMDLAASYAQEEAARRCLSVFGVLKSCLGVSQHDALVQLLPEEVQRWFREA